MPKKIKFKPTITRIKLNPEQAVLSCNCHTTAVTLTNPADRSETLGPWSNVCVGKSTGAIVACMSPHLSMPSYAVTGNTVSS